MAAESNRDDDLHVLIIGAGAAGLLAAHSLQKHGVRYSLFERDAAADYNQRPRDWSMGLHWARRMLPDLLPDDMVHRLWEIDADPFSMGGAADSNLSPGCGPPPIVEGYEFVLKGTQNTNFDIVDLVNGETLASVGAETSRRVSRRKLREFLRQGVNISFSKKLASISDLEGRQVKACFTDGTSATGTMILGTDSGNSAVRSHILPPSQNQLHYFPIRLYNFNARFTHEQALHIRRTATHPLFWYGIHDPTKTVFTSSILDVPDPHDGSTWLFQLGFDTWDTDASASKLASSDPPQTRTYTTDVSEIEPHKTAPEARLAEFREIAKQLIEPFSNYAAWVPEGTYISPDRISHLPVLHAWTGLGEQGRVALAGDAAHPMSPYRGQGLNNAVADVAEFIRAVRSIRAGAASLKDAMHAYQSEVRRRGQEEINVSGGQAYAVHHLEAFRKSVVVARGFHR